VAAEHGHVEAIEVLIKAGAQVDLQAKVRQYREKDTERDESKHFYAMPMLLMRRALFYSVFSLRCVSLFSLFHLSDFSFFFLLAFFLMLYKYLYCFQTVVLSSSVFLLLFIFTSHFCDAIFVFTLSVFSVCS
jgi:hypothetical protein